MQVKSIAECSKGEYSAILLTFIKLPFVIKIFVLSIVEWPFYTCFPALHYSVDFIFLSVGIIGFILLEVTDEAYMAETS